MVQLIMEFRECLKIRIMWQPFLCTCDLGYSNCAMYLTLLQDHDGINLQLSVSHAGILVFQNSTRINLFSWAKIRKLCFKRKKFILKLHPDGSVNISSDYKFNVCSEICYDGQPASHYFSFCSLNPQFFSFEGVHTVKSSCSHSFPEFEQVVLCYD